ncbi:MAG: LacI family DNA-binding transcriptional regulator [Rhodoglobus sp.]
MPKVEEPRRRKAPTLYDVARLAGVSHQTVSQVVKSGPNVKPDTRHRVEAAIAELNYTPNMAARTLATAKSHRIGVLFFDRYDDVGPTRTMQAAVDHARDAGFVVDIVGFDPRIPTRIDSAVELVLQAGVAGILVFTPTADVIDAVRQHDMPVPVVIDSIAASASVEPRVGMRIATEYLADLGHRRFAHVSGPLSWIPAQHRAGQFHAVVDERKLVVVAEFEGDWSSRSGYEAGLQMPVDQGITGIVVANDQMALGVLKALKQRNLRVPQDISVIGFDDIAEAGYFEPALTTISNDFEGQGRMAMDALLSLIDPRRSREVVSSRDPVLIVRESTSAPA